MIAPSSMSGLGACGWGYRGIAVRFQNFIVGECPAGWRTFVPAAGRRRFPLSLFFPRGTRVARAAAGRGGRRRGV